MRPIPRPFDGSNGRDPGAGRNPENGFMGLREEVVRHLVAAGLEWGGASWGQSNGDLMHFQLPASDPARQAVHRAGEAARRTAAT